MFSTAKRVVRGQCSLCSTPKKQENKEDLKLYVLDIRDSDMEFTKFVPKLVESDADFAACLRCWKIVGGYIANHVRVQKYE